MNEIAKEIVKEIVRNTGSAKVTEVEVNVMIDFLREMKQESLPYRGYRRDNMEYAAKVRKWIEEGERLMPGCHGVSFYFLFEPELQEDEDPVSSYNRGVEAYDRFSAMLSRLKQGCDWIIENKYGEHRSSGYQQLEAAYAARDLLEPHGVPISYSSPTSTYRSVARLLYEAMTGHSAADGADIERACEIAARDRAIVIATER
jgi:hypothetical protein